MKITVYLASSMGNPIYRDSVEAFGDWMAQKGYDLVYGGSQTGLMGLLQIGSWLMVERFTALCQIFFKNVRKSTKV